MKDLLPIRVTISLTVSNGMEGGQFLSVYMSIVLYVQSLMSWYYRYMCSIDWVGCILDCIYIYI